MTTPTPLERIYTDPEYWHRFRERLKRHGLERADSFWLWTLEPPDVQAARWAVERERVRREKATKKGDAP